MTSFKEDQVQNVQANVIQQYQWQETTITIRRTRG